MKMHGFADALITSALEGSLVVTVVGSGIVLARVRLLR